MYNFVCAISDQFRRECHLDVNFTTDHTRSLLFCHVPRRGFLARKTDPWIRVPSIGMDEIPFPRNFV